MARYTDANVPCDSCGQFVANHEWTEPKRDDDESEDSFQARRNEAQYERGKNHDPNIKCSGYKPAATTK